MVDQAERPNRDGSKSRTANLREPLRSQLEEHAPGARIVAEGLLGAGDGRIDFVLVEPDGRAVLVFVGSADEALALIARAVAQRAWVALRLADWLQLAPNLGVRPQAGARALVLCPDFCAEARAAAAALGNESVTLAALRAHPAEELRDQPGPAGSPEAVASPAPASSSGVQPGVFRTGLSDADLGLAPGPELEPLLGSFRPLNPRGNS